MDRRGFLRSVGQGAAGVVLWGCQRGGGAGRAKGVERRPNILLMIADDMTWRDCAPYGNREVQTPQMSGLAREGMCLDGMFTATAMCAPTRQQLYTGMFPVRNGAYPNHSRVYDGVKSVVHHLKELGYRVGLIGKRHFNPPGSFPFETVKSKEGASDTAAIRRFISRDTEQPYCLIVASKEPHGPWNRGDPGAYRAETLSVPEYLVDCAETRAGLVKYYAEITYLDCQLGGCLEAVEASGQKDDTIVIFTSEQGSGIPFGGKWSCYENGLKTAFIVRWPGKVKAGSRSAALTQYVDVLPTLIEAAGGDPKQIETGRADATGKKGFDGRSFLKVLLGQTDHHRNYVYGVHTTRGIINGSACYPIRSVRSKRYKYILNPNHETVFYNVVSTGGGNLLDVWKKIGESDPAAAARARFYQHRPAEELYDLERDPYELKNLAGEASLLAIKAALKKELEAWMGQQGDEGNATEMKATERQGLSGRPNWRAWDPENPPPARKKKR